MINLTVQLMNRIINGTCDLILRQVSNRIIRIKYDVLRK